MICRTFGAQVSQCMHSIINASDRLGFCGIKGQMAVDRTPNWFNNTTPLCDDMEWKYSVAIGDPIQFQFPEAKCVVGNSSKGDPLAYPCCSEPTLDKFPNTPFNNKIVYSPRVNLHTPKTITNALGSIDYNTELNMADVVQNGKAQYAAGWNGYSFCDQCGIPVPCGYKTAQAIANDPVLGRTEVTGIFNCCSEPPACMFPKKTYGTDVGYLTDDKGSTDSNMTSRVYKLPFWNGYSFCTAIHDEPYAQAKTCRPE